MRSWMACVLRSLGVMMAASIVPYMTGCCWEGVTLAGSKGLRCLLTLLATEVCHHSFLRWPRLTDVRGGAFGRRSGVVDARRATVVRGVGVAL